jgi:hypothetical protein
MDDKMWQNSYNGSFSSLEKEENSGTCYNMGDVMLSDHKRTKHCIFPLK